MRVFFVSFLAGFGVSSDVDSVSGLCSCWGSGSGSGNITGCIVGLMGSTGGLDTFENIDRGVEVPIACGVHRVPLPVWTKG